MTAPPMLPADAPEWPYPSTSHIGMRVLRLRRVVRRRLERFRAVEVRGVQRWMALDLWQALGYDPCAFDAFVAEVGWADTWSILLGEARVTRSFKNQLRGD